MTSAINSLAADVDVALDAASVQMPESSYRREHGSRAFAKETVTPFLVYLANYSDDMEIAESAGRLAEEIRHVR